MQIRVSPAIINYTKLNKSYTCYNCFLLKSIIDLSALLSQLCQNCSAIKKKKSLFSLMVMFHGTIRYNDF